MLAQLIPEVLEMLLRDASFQKRTRISARRSVPLEINKVARLIAVLAMKEVVVPHFLKRRQRCISRDVPADPRIVLVSPNHHGHRVPADQALDAPLNLP